MAIFGGYVIFPGFCLGASFQNKTFCNVFSMYSLIKYSIFTSNLLETIELLYKFFNLVAYFCHHHWLQYIVLVFLGVCQNLWYFYLFIFLVKNQGRN